MEEKLKDLYNQCIEELNRIGIYVNNEDIGTINIKIAKRNSKRYGVCKQENPDKTKYHYIKRGYKSYKVYDSFKTHNIEIYKWVMELDEKIIKNTIMHEIIHCFPNCNNHGKEFKRHANYINRNLGYNISRVGNKKEDYIKSNLEYREQGETYKYKIICNNCNQIFYRKRIAKNFIRRYRCGKCGGKFEIVM